MCVRNGNDDDDDDDVVCKPFAMWRLQMYIHKCVDGFSYVECIMQRL